MKRKYNKKMTSMCAALVLSLAMTAPVVAAQDRIVIRGNVNTENLTITYNGNGSFTVAQTYPFRSTRRMGGEGSRHSSATRHGGNSVSLYFGIDNGILTISDTPIAPVANANRPANNRSTNNRRTTNNTPAPPVATAPAQPQAPEPDNVAVPEASDNLEMRGSQIQLPNRRLTDSERQEWINEYWEMGGPTANELEVLRLVNIERTQRGLVAVEWDNTLGMAARFYAQQPRDLREPGGGITLSHNFGPYADNPNARHGASANVARAFGANLHWGGGNGFSGGMGAEALVNGWMNSAGHRRYILSPEHRFLGMGQKEGGISYLFLSESASN